MADGVPTLCRKHPGGLAPLPAGAGLLPPPRGASQRGPARVTGTTPALPLPPAGPSPRQAGGKGPVGAKHRKGGEQCEGYLKVRRGIPRRLEQVRALCSNARSQQLRPQWSEEAGVPPGGTEGERACRGEPWPRGRTPGPPCNRGPGTQKARGVCVPVHEHLGPRDRRGRALQGGGARHWGRRWLRSAVKGR